jgi:hypothetical protein
MFPTGLSPSWLHTSKDTTKEAICLGRLLVCPVFTGLRFPNWIWLSFIGDIDGESPVRALQVLRDDYSASLVSVQRFRGKLGGRQGTFVLQGQEIVAARSRGLGLSFPDRGQVTLPDCAARATLEKGQMERWITGSNDVAARKMDSLRSDRAPLRS